MLQVKHVSKWYKTGDFIQTALNDVSLNLRNNEFVSILGPSGSGKTTLLNIIGGLDHYDQGDLIINGITTQKYKDRDWDSYRNHTIGFVFQSYNLIPHQSILSNVEMALTISGISKKKRKQRALQALEEVGLKEHVHKRPNQLSGGQMQRVAIARALVNDPDILLADEPTGALDTETSIQVMELLKKVAEKRLVVMVTHNPELAEAYSSRIVKLRDGRVIGDTDPFEVAEVSAENLQNKNMGKAKMGFGTALALSFNNLRTKKGRTILTAFAGSIGIIGIALILALSSGVNKYIADVQKQTMTSYPITIDAQTFDMTSMMTASTSMKQQNQGHDDTKVYADFQQMQAEALMSAGIVKNDLASFKKYLEDPNSDIQKYVGENGIVYSYNVKFDVFSYDKDGKYINAASKTEDLTGNGDQSFSVNGIQMLFSTNNNVVSTNFQQLMAGSDGNLISPVITDNYDLVYGSWPKAYDEVVLILSENNTITIDSLYQLGLVTGEEYVKLSEQFENKESVEDLTFDYEEICKHEFDLIPYCDRYQKNEMGMYSYVEDSNIQYLQSKALKLKIVGIIRLQEDGENMSLMSPVGYTSLLTNYLIDHTKDSEIVKAQNENQDVNVLNGLKFTVASDEEKKQIALSYMTAMGMITPDMPVDDASLIGFYDMYMSKESYDNNMEKFGYVDYDTPSSISIYADSFEGKESISECINNYNETAGKDTKITYVDYVALLTGSITSIIDVISYVLIAFVAVSLVVSSIMIGIITHISVLERTKEIGILRALGASKGNVSQVFIAETVIIGFLSGLIGVLVTWLLTFPINGIISALAQTDSVKAFLPVTAAIILVVISMVITTIGGFIPAKKAAKKDPVTALRTE